MLNFTLFCQVQGNCIKYGGGYAKKACGCETPAPLTYDTKVLYDIACDCIYAENEQRRFWRKHRPAPDAPINLRTESDKIDYYRHDEATNALWYSFSRACKMVHADPGTVLATVKAMNRYEKRVKWQVCAHLPEYGYDNSYTPADERLRRFWNAAE